MLSTSCRASQRDGLYSFILDSRDVFSPDKGINDIDPEKYDDEAVLYSLFNTMDGPLGSFSPNDIDVSWLSNVPFIENDLVTKFSAFFTEFKRS